MNGNAGKSADADAARPDAVYIVDAVLKPLMVFDKKPRIRQNFLSECCQMHAVSVPLQQNHIPFFFQIGNHLAHRRLGIMQAFRRLGKAPRFHGFHKRHVF